GAGLRRRPARQRAAGPGRGPARHRRTGDPLAAPPPDGGQAHPGRQTGNRRVLRSAMVERERPAGRLPRALAAAHRDLSRGRTPRRVKESTTVTTPITRDDCAARDAAAPPAPSRDECVLPDGVVYLDGNSLGALPRATPARVAELVEREWGQRLIASWNEAGWWDKPRTLGALLAPLVGAGADE